MNVFTCCISVPRSLRYMDTGESKYLNNASSLEESETGE